MRPHHHQDLLFSQWSKYEGSQPGATHSNPSGEGTFLLKVDGDADDGGKVDQTEPETWRSVVSSLMTGARVRPVRMPTVK